MKSTSIIKHNLMRAAMTLALIMTCATAWAQTTQSVTYIDENGQTQTVNATVLTGTGELTANQWYVVNSDVTINNSSERIYSSGNIKLILADGKTFTISSNNTNGIICSSGTVSIYGQENGTGTLNVTATGSSGNAIYGYNGVNIVGCHITATSTGANGIQSRENITISGGQVSATGGNDNYGLRTFDTITLGWRKTTDHVYANSYRGTVKVKDGQAFKDSDGNIYVGTLTGEQMANLNGKTLTPYYANDFSVNADSTEYTIHTATGWGVFCAALQDNNTWNRFSGKTVKLGANISITQSAGSAGHEFMGTFDGDEKTLTVDITETTTQGTAPFREINGATIQNLVVTGSVDGTTHAAGLVGYARGDNANTVNTITNCKVATNVTVTTPNSAGNYHCGGVVGHALQCTLNMSNTVYCGNITNSGNYVGGLQGWSDGNTINFSHCLFVGSYSGTSTGTASFHPVAVRYNNSATTADVSHVYYTATPTLTNSSFIAADGTKATGRTTAPDNLGSYEATYSFMDMTVYENGLLYNGLYYVAPTLNTDNSGAYLISSVDDWTNFCDMLYDNGTYNRFSGQTVKLGANIEVSRMAGANSHDFCGTFDGQNNTLTFNHTAADNYCAPFRYVQGSSNTDHAIIQNLNVVSNITAADYRHPAGLIALQSGYVDVTDCNAVVNINCTKGTNNPNDLYPAGLVSQSNNTGSLTVCGCTVSGTISTDGKYAAGMVGIVQGSANITNSVSSVTINSSTSGDGTHGGFVALLPSGRQLTIEGCVFNGKIVTTNGTTNCGGFLGHNNTVGGTGATITNCLYAPAADPNTVSTDCATFGRNVSSDLISNCYYTRTLGTEQGMQAHSITAGENVTVENAGTATAYATSGITSYGTGIKYNNVLYAGNEETISLTLGNTPPTYYGLTGYTTTGGTLTGNSNPYTLTMPNENVIIGATFELQPVSVNYLDENGQQQTHDALPLLGGGATTLAAGWYVVNSDISYTGTVSLVGSGDVKLILADDHTMNIGTSENRIEYGIETYNNAQTLTIYGQSIGDHMGILSVYSSHYCIYPVALTINGGHVIANADGNDATALRTTYQAITINGGIVEATATGTGAYAIHSGDNFTYAGGTLITNAASENAIYAYYKRYTFTWRNPNDSITIGSTGLYAPDNTYTAPFTKAFTDGTNIYSGTLRGSQLNALAGRTLYPVTAYKTIAAHSTTEQPVSGWYLIASPVGDVSATAVNNLANTNDNDGFDLYRFNQSAELEWENWKSQECEGNHYHFDLESGRGYLYANAENVNLIFTGTPYDGDGVVTLTKATDAGIEFSGWNLVGNPFNETAYIDKTDFYRMNAEGSEIVAATDNAIAPMEGIFVLADENVETLTFSAQEPNKGHSEKPKPEQIVLNLSRNGGSVIDRAIVRMGEAQTLPKFQIRENSTKIYIPQGGKDYAIVSVGNVSEIPVNFKAEENGTYTLTVSPTLNSQLSTLNYLHLIDNITGADIDLIPSLRAERSNPEPPVSYTFTAKTTDYESRFKLVFIANDASTGSTSDATFAFVSNGNLIVNGEGTLQVIDLLGRVIRTVGLSQCGSRTSTAGMTPCVYVLRLINGDNVRTQKIVIP